MMIGTLVGTQFLPTDVGLTMPDSSLIFTWAAIAAFWGWICFDDKEKIWSSILWITALALVIIPIALQYVDNQEKNQTNRIENIKQVYDVDDVLTKGWSEENPKVTIIENGKAFEVILSENQTTYEPTLATLPGNSELDVEELKHTTK